MVRIGRPGMPLALPDCPRQGIGNETDFHRLVAFSAAGRILHRNLESLLLGQI